MSQTLRNAVVSAGTAIVVLFLFGLTWDTTFDGAPLNTENVAQGATRIRETRTETRQRQETGHDFGVLQGAYSFPADLGQNFDTGRHHMGSSRIFIATGTGIGTDDCTIDFPPATGLGEDDFDGDNNLDNGRLCFDDDGTMYVFNGATVADPPTGGTWQLLFSTENQIAAGMIVIREDATACPTGWTDVTTTSGYEGVIIRGADLAAGIAGIPDTAGIDCPGGVGCSGTAAEYDDTIAIAELPLHGHPYRLNDGGEGTSNVDGGIMIGSVNARTDFAAFTGTLSDTAGEQIGGTGGAGDNFHPMRTVRFCKKDA